MIRARRRRQIVGELFQLAFQLRDPREMIRDRPRGFFELFLLRLKRFRFGAFTEDFTIKRGDLTATKAALDF